MNLHEWRHSASVTGSMKYPPQRTQTICGFKSLRLIFFNILRNLKRKKKNTGSKICRKVFLSFGAKPCCGFDGTSAHMVESSTRLVEVTGSTLSNARKTFFAVSCVCLDGHLIFLWSVVTFTELVQLHNSAFKQQANVIMLWAQGSLF